MHPKYRFHPGASPSNAAANVGSVFHYHLVVNGVPGDFFWLVRLGKLGKPTFHLCSNRHSHPGFPGVPPGFPVASTPPPWLSAWSDSAVGWAPRHKQRASRCCSSAARRPHGVTGSAPSWILICDNFVIVSTLVRINDQVNPPCHATAIWQPLLLPLHTLA